MNDRNTEVKGFLLTKTVDQNPRDEQGVSVSHVELVFLTEGFVALLFTEITNCTVLGGTD